MGLVPISPPPLPDAKAIKELATNTLNQTAKAAKVDWQVETQTWDNKPKIRIWKPKKYERVVGARMDHQGGKQLRWVAKGTKPHVIKARNKSHLTFRVGYRRKSFGGSRIGSRAGGSFGGFRKAKEVLHPGNKPTNSDVKIMNKHKRLMYLQVDRASRALLTKRGKRR